MFIIERNRKIKASMILTTSRDSRLVRDIVDYGGWTNDAGRGAQQCWREGLVDRI